MRPNGTRRNASGFTTVEFVAGVGLLLLPVTLLIGVLPTWADRESTARAAAREASRTCVITGSEASARDAFKQILDNRDVPHQDATLKWDQPDYDCPAGLSTDNTRDGVRAIVEFKFPIIKLPLFGVSTGSVKKTTTHIEYTDIYINTP